ncbi:hypothetical protein [Hyalangium sp.]|uniref:hypothetical protein n=1 Tax=Hyalangium sp. TaxID=2028555 RepID=UPI002D71F2A1|nr:hypothetical protein [Hyalangium sp.]HYI01584.1 hypothetical protein [Hyalangium sp.]
MTLNEFFDASYQWGEQNAQLILLLGVAVPALGTLLAFIGKGGKTDEDGRFIASAVMGFAMFAVVLEIMALFVGHFLRGSSILEANAALLIAPILCLVGSVLGLRLVFPLAEIGVVRSILDMGGFFVSCLLVMWFMSKFRGWNITIFGSLFTFLIIVLLAFWFMRRQYRRAFGLDRTRKVHPG